MVEGKTKIIFPMLVGAGIGIVTTKDDITAGDGAKHDVMEGKAELATRTTCNVFELLAREDIPVAYIGRDGPTTFLTKICEMIPVEVVVRGIATGSYLKRNPSITDGTVLTPRVVEFFYKTTGRRIGIHDLPCDDPFMLPSTHETEWHLFHPGKSADGYIGKLSKMVELDPSAFAAQLSVCKAIAMNVFDILDRTWTNRCGGTLYDFKLEFGVLPGGEIVVGDVIDCDSWRVRWNGLQLSKQGYREGEYLNRVLDIYRLAASLTDRFVAR